jgi:DNA-binding winged helix-turn-helix (wHTH) protein
MNHGETQANWPVLIIGDYLFEPTIGLISGPGGSHHVCARTSALLLYLAEHHNGVVDRDQLIRDLWHDAPGAGKALNQSIARLRHYFGDSARSARYIETVPSRGYRLVSAVYGRDNVQETARAAERSRRIHENRGRLRNFFFELRDRKVCRAMLVYAIVVWLMAQVSEIVAPALDLPDWFTTFIVVVGILGFPIAAVLAWIFDITPDGLVLDVESSKAPAAASSRSRVEMLIDTALIACAALLATQLLLDAFSGDAGARLDTSTPAPVSETRSGHRPAIAGPPLPASDSAPLASHVELPMSLSMSEFSLGRGEPVAAPSDVFDGSNAKTVIVPGRFGIGFH